MTKVITYGTYDLLHYGHIRLLERAKTLGDYLIVGVTADDFDKTRGKINVKQSLMERVEAVRATGIADEIIVEEYEGQKIDDIKRYGIDIFTVGSDWIGKFDYLNNYCKVVYLPRTEGVSSSEIREEQRSIALGLVGDTSFLNKVADEVSYVNGIHLSGICTSSIHVFSDKIKTLPFITDDYDKLLAVSDAVYIRSQPEHHYDQIKRALSCGKHVLCESPVCTDVDKYKSIREYADKKGLILFEGIKTAYSTAYSRLLLLIKGGKIGKVVSVNATCTSLKKEADHDPSINRHAWNGIYEWGPTALLPVFQILGNQYVHKYYAVQYSDSSMKYDSFLKGDFVYKDAVASIQIGNGVKSEGELIIAGTKGYAYVPSPWWKTDYFELRYENPADNKRYFYQLEGEGIRYELVAFARSIECGKEITEIGRETTEAIVKTIMEMNDPRNLFVLSI